MQPWRVRVLSAPCAAHDRFIGQMSSGCQCQKPLLILLHSVFLQRSLITIFDKIRAACALIEFGAKTAFRKAVKTEGNPFSQMGPHAPLQKSKTRGTEESGFRIEHQVHQYPGAPLSQTLDVSLGASVEVMGPSQGVIWLFPEEDGKN